MLWLVLLISVTNLAVGFGLSSFLQLLEKWDSDEATADAPSTASPDPAPAAPAAKPLSQADCLAMLMGTAPAAGDNPSPSTPDAESDPAAVPPEPEPVVVTAQAVEELKLPQGWVTLLEGQKVNSVTEAALHVLKLDVVGYLKRLMKVDELARSIQDDNDAPRAAACVGELNQANAAWLARQKEADEQLQANPPTDQDLGACNTRVREILSEQSERIDQLKRLIETLEFEQLTQDVAKLLKHLTRLIELAHHLRDTMHELLAAVLRNEGRLNEPATEALQDAETGALNPVGLARTMERWWKDDPSHARELTLGVIDVDGMGALNLRHGPLAGDLVLAALGKVLQTTMRQNRGFDRLTRYNGQRFVLFFGDTGPRGATSAIERFRQSIAAAHFYYNDELLDLSVSCGVTNWRPTDTPDLLLSRACTALFTSKDQGRGCTALDEGSGPEKIEPPSYNVRSQRFILQA